MVIDITGQAITCILLAASAVLLQWSTSRLGRVKERLDLRPPALALVAAGRAMRDESVELKSSSETGRDLKSCWLLYVKSVIAAVILNEHRGLIGRKFDPLAPPRALFGPGGSPPFSEPCTFDWNEYIAFDFYERRHWEIHDSILFGRNAPQQSASRDGALKAGAEWALVPHSWWVCREDKGLFFAWCSASFFRSYTSRFSASGSCLVGGSRAIPRGS
jgi:hypothetical protein